MKSIDAIDIISEFIEIQAELVKSLVQLNFNNKPITTLDLVLSSNRTGEISTDKAIWRYRIHGDGVIFIRKSGRPIKIDVEIRPIECSDGITPHRLYQYIRSTKNQSISHNRNTLHQPKEIDISEILKSLEKTGYLEQHPSSQCVGCYRIATTNQVIVDSD